MEKILLVKITINFLFKKTSILLASATDELID